MVAGIATSKAAHINVSLFITFLLSFYPVFLSGSDKRIVRGSPVKTITIKANTLVVNNRPKMLHTLDFINLMKTSMLKLPWGSPSFHSTD